MSRIDDAVAAQRRALAAREAATVRRLQMVWAASEVRIRRRLGTLMDALDERVRLGLPVDPVWLAQEVRYGALLDQVEQEAGRLAALTGQMVVADTTWAVSTGVDAAVRVVGLTATVGATLNVPAVEAIAATVHEVISPLRTVLTQFGQQVAAQFGDALIQGIALGHGPLQVAADVSGRLGVPLSRARLITRTEMLRAYRTATLHTYQQNTDVLLGWEWRSARTVRTCPACWAMDGQRFPVTEPMGTHPACRCVMIPITASTRERATGPNVFDQLTSAEQEQVLGPSAFRAYQAGAVSLADLVAVRHSPAWGVSRTTRSLVGAVGPTAAARFYQR